MTLFCPPATLMHMPSRFLVRGGRALSGLVRPAGNKNAALPILAATLLADGPVDVTNVPRIRDVEMMLALLEDLGASVSWTGPNAVRVDPAHVFGAQVGRDPAAGRGLRDGRQLVGADEPVGPLIGAMGPEAQLVPRRRAGQSRKGRLAQVDGLGRQRIRDVEDEPGVPADVAAGARSVHEHIRYLIRSFKLEEEALAGQAS
ncbi:MAG: hypothetical protein ABI647_19870, partial [Gemmatimonadota bacterium]